MGLGIVGARTPFGSVRLPAPEVPTTSRAAPTGGREDEAPTYIRASRSSGRRECRRSDRRGSHLPDCERERDAEERGSPAALDHGGRKTRLDARQGPGSRRGGNITTRRQGTSSSTCSTGPRRVSSRRPAPGPESSANSLAELTSARTTLKGARPSPARPGRPTRGPTRSSSPPTARSGARPYARLTKVVDGLGAEAELQRTKGEFEDLHRGRRRDHRLRRALLAGLQRGQGGPAVLHHRRDHPGPFPDSSDSSGRRSARTSSPASPATTSVWSSTPRRSTTRARSISTTAPRSPSPRRVRRPSGSR